MQVGPLLKRWRRARRMSQQDLAFASEVSTRHISFVENGKSAPSREMVLVLASALDMPLRERNVLLRSAGFAPAYRESQLNHPDMAGVRQVLDIMLEHQEPYPALVLDHMWNLVRMNTAGMRVMGYFLADADPSLLRNVMHALFHPDGFRRFVVNFDEVANALIARSDDRTRWQSDANTSFGAGSVRGRFGEDGSRELGPRVCGGDSSASAQGRRRGSVSDDDHHTRNALGCDGAGASHRVVFSGRCGFALVDRVVGAELSVRSWLPGAPRTRSDL